MQRQLNANRAGLLAKDLQKGKPCPVCGSTKHPKIAALPKDHITEKQLEENVDEYAVITDGMLDLGALMREEILLNFPTRFLCAPDCPGLCPKCGKSLKDGKCGCPEHEPDPRLAILGTLLDRDGTEKQ